LKVVQETAGGNDEVRWTYNFWFDMVTDFFYIFWVAACAAVLAIIPPAVAGLFVPVDDLVWWLLFFVIFLLAFPLMLLSTMAGGNVFLVIYPPLLPRLLRQPEIILLIYANTFLPALVCLGLGYLLVGKYLVWLVPLIGYIWANCWLVFARFLGRVGWVLADEEVKTPPRKRRKKALAVRSAE
jgi:hypothetical protein